MAQYQIIKRSIALRGEQRCKWEFCAHGARYERNEAIAQKMRIEANGWQARLIRI